MSRVLLVLLALSSLACCAPPVPAAVPKSTLDARVQRIASEELDRAVASWQPAAAVVLVLDAASGHVLAAQSRGGDALNRPYITGSTLKAFTLAAALEAGTVTPDTQVDCTTRSYGSAELRDGTPHGSLSVRDVLVTSSNVGSSRVFDTVGLAALRTMLLRVHLGDAPGALPQPADGASMEAALLAIGESAMATPLQVAAAYAAIWNGGTYLAPTDTTLERAAEGVLSPAVAQALSQMLEAAVTSELGTGKLAQIPGLRVAGKTGTAQLDGGRLYASFVGTVLDRTPRLVVLVGLEAPREGGSGPSAAAPAFAAVARRLFEPAP
jgi:cell division protein FtsI (penicillin-binding protein 3)